MKSMSSLSRGSGGQVVGSFSIAWGEGGGGKERERMNMFLMALFCRIIFSTSFIRVVEHFALATNSSSIY